ncbi:hypothetical protein G6F39_013671 [Rhizopus arrhizus]|nr:hypothetical protein G6F39_013671 [Rhizopus arrhizus]
MLEEPTTIIEEDLILEEVTSTLGDNQEVTLDNSKANDLFLGEATPPSSNRTPTPNNDRPRNHLNNNEQEGSSPIFYGKIPGISKPPLRNTGRWDITRGSTPIIQPVLEIPYQPPLAIGGNSRGIQNSVEFYPTIMEISPHETQVIGRPIGTKNICQTSSQSRRKPKDDLS